MKTGFFAHRLLCLCMVLVALMAGLSGCTGTPAEETLGVSEATQSPEEEAVFKILMIGTSHGQDIVWLLHRVLKAEMPEREFLVGDIYASVGLDMHRLYIQSNAKEYRYSEITESSVTRTDGYTLEGALKKEQWDLIIFQEGASQYARAAEYQDGDHEFMIDYIRKTAAPGYKLAYNAPWAQPTSAELYTQTRATPPESFRGRYFSSFEGSRNLQYSMICENINKYIEPHQDIDLVLYTGTAVHYASETVGVPEATPERTIDLYRDYIHLSDFGRLLAAYQLYAQIFALEKLESVKVDAIPAALRATFREQALGDVAITEEGKQAIIASVNYALTEPNTKPPQTAREPAVLEPIN